MPQEPLKKPAKGKMTTRIQYDEDIAQVAVTIRFSTQRAARDYARTMGKDCGNPLLAAALD